MRWDWRKRCCWWWWRWGGGGESERGRWYKMERLGMSETCSGMVARERRAVMWIYFKCLQRCCRRSRRPATGQRRKKGVLGGGGVADSVFTHNELCASVEDWSPSQDHFLRASVRSHTQRHFYSVVSQLRTGWTLDFRLRLVKTRPHCNDTIMEKTPAAAISRSLCDTQNESQEGRKLLKDTSLKRDVAVSLRRSYIWKKILAITFLFFFDMTVCAVLTTTLLCTSSCSNFPHLVSDETKQAHHTTAQQRL